MFRKIFLAIFVAFVASTLAQDDAPKDAPNDDLDCDPCVCPSDPQLTVDRLIPNVGDVEDLLWDHFNDAINTVGDIAPFIFDFDLKNWYQTRFFKEGGDRTCFGGEAVDAVFEIDSKTYAAEFSLIMDITPTGFKVFSCDCVQKDNHTDVDICGNYLREKIEDKLNLLTCLALDTTK